MLDFFGRKKHTASTTDFEKPTLHSKGPEEIMDPGKVDSVIGPDVSAKGPEEIMDAGKVDSVIGPSLIVKGEIQSSGVLRIDGVIEGTISANGTVVVAKDGVVKADVTADHIVVGGTIHGNVIARKKVQILSTGTLHGGVTTTVHGFAVQEGAVFDGSCTMGKGEGGKAVVTEKDAPARQRSTKG